MWKSVGLLSPLLCMVETATLQSLFVKRQFVPLCGHMEAVTPHLVCTDKKVIIFPVKITAQAKDVWKQQNKTSPTQQLHQVHVGTLNSMGQTRHMNLLRVPDQTLWPSSQVCAIPPAHCQTVRCLCHRINQGMMDFPPCSFSPAQAPPHLTAIAMWCVCQPYLVTYRDGHTLTPTTALSLPLPSCEYLWEMVCVP